MNKYFCRQNQLITLIIALIFITIGELLCQDTSKELDLFSYKSRLKFGNHLYFEKDYLRASYEFREYLKYEDNDTIRYRFANCFYSIGRFSEAADNFKSIFYNSTIQDESRLAYFKSLFFSGDFNLFRNSSRNEIYLPEKYLTEIDRLYFTSFLLDNSVLPDTVNFISAFPDSNKNDIRKFYFQKKFPESKSPTTAALLSSIIPGLGKIYAGKITDGLTSFLVTGLLTFLAVDNFNHKHTFRGWLFTGLGAFFYAGNIYGSAAAATIFNAGVKFNFDNDVKSYFEKRNYFLPENNL